MKARIVLVAAAVVSLHLVPGPASATHNCTKEEPRCTDRRTLVEKPERQVITSRVLGHHCYDDFSASLPDRDRRELYSRVEVAFSNVTHRSGHLDTITIHIEGQEPHAVGRVDAIGKKNDFHAADWDRRPPGSKLTFEVGKKVDFYFGKENRDIGRYRIEHRPVANGPAGGGQAGKDPGRNPSPGGRPSVSVDCEGQHGLTMEVVPPSPPRCQRRDQPCPA
jgi:hypothetical protein